MPSVLVLSDRRGWISPITDAFASCFDSKGWIVTRASRPGLSGGFDLVCGWGWGSEVMQWAISKWPGKTVHADLGFWNRSPNGHFKISIGERWAPLSNHDYDASRLHSLEVEVMPSRSPGNCILVCGMSAKACRDWMMVPGQWERSVIARLRKKGAQVIYRPKPQSRHIPRPRFPRARDLPDCEIDHGPMSEAFSRVDAVVAHHSNVVVEALAAGLPIYAEIGISKTMSVKSLEDLPGSKALDVKTRARFLRQVAWHQWTCEEIMAGAWLKPPAPLSDHPVFS